MADKKIKMIKYFKEGIRITPLIQFSTLHQIVKDLKLNYFIHKNKIILYANEISDFVDIHHMAEKFYYYDIMVYSYEKGRWVLIIGERENTSNKTYKLFSKIFKEVINEIQ